MMAVMALQSDQQLQLQLQPSCKRGVTAFFHSSLSTFVASARSYFSVCSAAAAAQREKERASLSCWTWMMK